MQWRVSRRYLLAEILFERSLFARSNTARRELLSPRPARFMKYVSIRIPDCGPLGDTFLEANARAIVGALFVNNLSGG